jgi:hypothetical protein
MARLLSQLGLLVAVGTIFGAGGLAWAADGGAKPLKLIPLKAVFDTSVYLPQKSSPFQIGIKHTNIIYPTKLKLRGDAKLVNLRGEENGNLLKGTVVEKSAPPTSSITTVERGITSRFHLDLSAMIPQIAPDLSRSLEGEVEKSKRALAAALQAMPTPSANKSPNLAGRIPNTAIPLAANAAPNAVPRIPTVAPTTPDLSRQIAAAAQQAAKAASVASGGGNSPAGPMMGGAGSGSGGGAGGGGAGGGGKLNGMPPGGTIGGIPAAGVPTGALKMPTIPNTGVNGKLKMPDAPSNNVSAKLAIPKTNATVASTDLDAQLRNANTKAQLLAQNVSPLLATQNANAKLLPSAKIPVAATDVNGEVLGSKLSIQWDDWHKRFAKLAGDQLLARVKASGNPLGKNTVRITVTPGRHLTVSSEKPSNAKFDAAVLAAYRSLDHSASLEYPKGSLRSSVSFLIDNDYSKPGIPIVVRSKTLTNDHEEIRRGR